MIKHYYLLLIVLMPTLLSAQITFVQQTTPVGTTLMGISFANPDTGYACGDLGVVLKTTNGGTTWTALTNATTNELWDIKVIPGSNGQKVIAVGINNTIIKSIDGGSSWTTQSVPFMTGSFVFGIHCLDDQNYYACGGDFATSSGAVLKTTNGGATWTATPVSTSFFIDKIFMLNAATGYVAGTNTNLNDGSLHHTTNGSSWAVTKTISSVITNVWATATNNVVAVGLNGKIWRSTDNGVNWTDVSANTLDLYGVCFKDGKTGFACGGDQANNMILQTVDSGKTWTQVTLNSNDGLKAIAITGNRIFMAGEGGRIFRVTLPSASVAHIGNQLSFSVYPNPAGRVIYLQGLPERQSFQVNITDLAGRVVMQQANITNGAQMDISSCSKGLYQLQVFSEGAVFSGVQLFEVQ